MLTKSEQKRAWRHDRIAKGLCIYCNTVAVVGRQMCERHMQEGRERTAHTRKARVSKNLCVVCGGTPLPRRRKCHLCSVSHSQIQNSRHLRLKEAKRCPRCTKGKPKNGHVYCARCLKLYAGAATVRKVKKERVAEFRRLWHMDPMGVAMRFEKLMLGDRNDTVNWCKTRQGVGRCC